MLLYLSVGVLQAVVYGILLRDVLKKFILRARSKWMYASPELVLSSVCDK